ncbi:RagB/SusD family nutrient uptake outer membrane protein [Chryseobacterium profundimaris]|uniref:Starch-binding associating with outer membrane n=1 Tax=Chryseobacterium profundimaris TaxID=1387275 RepID=A0ABY1NP50_9FLAO|nr:RagB/SusD family nutrient uptake outer membrane protein [Chryseobacterium profundimaris]SMP14656.1 Starch-binding associating with outer membrane [Chryseobacterium profundimaris]
MKIIFKQHRFLKKTLILSSMVIAILAANSCNDDFLDQPAYNTADSDVVFQNLQTAEMFVLGCYKGLVPTEMFYQLGAGDTVNHSVEALNNSKYNVCNYNYDAYAPFTVTGIYSAMYAVIERTNIAVYQLGKMPASEKRDALIGEAKSIRAFCYYNLIRIYGDVPSVFEPLETLDPNDENTFYPKRASRDEIYDRIVGDLQEATVTVPTLAASGFGTTERLSKEGVNALLARIALYAAGYSLRWELNTSNPGMVSRRSDNARVRELYQIADNACAAIINGGTKSLVQSQGGKSGFETLWFNFDRRNYATVNSEMLWHIASLGQNTNSAFQVYAHPGYRNGVFGSRSSQQMILPSYYLSFNQNDTRRDVTCTSYSVYFLESGAAGDTFVDVGTTYSAIMPGKFRLSWCVEPQAAADRNLNIPLLRYADVLLMYAETQNYLNNGPTAAANAALMAVRTRAGIGSLPLPSGQTNFLKAIVQERKWEFAGEFMLRTDLIRTNSLTTEIEATRQDMKDLTKRVGKYTNVATYRLYKFHKNSQVYGDSFLALPYIEITDPTEIATIQNVPTSSANYAAYQTALRAIVAAHGQPTSTEDKWYPTQMFEAYTSTFNGNARKAVGFGAGFNVLGMGNNMYSKPFGYAENGNAYPGWVESANDGLFFGFQTNKTELLPFAAASAGHPMIDNPNLTQLPGY